MIRDRELIAVRRDGVRRIPADLVANETVLKHLPGVLNLLADAGYDDEAVLRWLYEPDDTLPGATAGRRPRRRPGPRGKAPGPGPRLLTPPPPLSASPALIMRLAARSRRGEGR